MFGTLWPERLLFPTCLQCGDIVYMSYRNFEELRICRRCGAERVLPLAHREFWRSALGVLYLLVLPIDVCFWLLLWPVRVLRRH